MTVRSNPPRYDGYHVPYWPSFIQSRLRTWPHDVDKTPPRKVSDVRQIFPHPDPTIMVSKCWLAIKSAGARDEGGFFRPPVMLKGTSRPIRELLVVSGKRCKEYCLTLPASLAPRLFQRAMVVGSSPAPSLHISAIEAFFWMETIMRLVLFPSLLAHAGSWRHVEKWATLLRQWNYICANFWSAGICPWKAHLTCYRIGCLSAFSSLFTSILWASRHLLLAIVSTSLFWARRAWKKEHELKFWVRFLIFSRVLFRA